MRIRYSELIKCRKGQQDTCKQELLQKRVLDLEFE